MFIINEGELSRASIKVVPKLWGKEFIILNTEHYCCKFLKVMPGFICSIHAHTKKDETFVGIFGVLQLHIHKANMDIEHTAAIYPGQKYHIQPGTYHSFQAVNPSWVMEISTMHSDYDVDRLRESRKLETIK